MLLPHTVSRIPSIMDPFWITDCDFPNPAWWLFCGCMLCTHFSVIMLKIAALHTKRQFDWRVLHFHTHHRDQRHTTYMAAYVICDITPGSGHSVPGVANIYPLQAVGKVYTGSCNVCHCRTVCR